MNELLTAAESIAATIKSRLSHGHGMAYVDAEAKVDGHLVVIRVVWVHTSNQRRYGYRYSMSPKFYARCRDKEGYAAQVVDFCMYEVQRVMRGKR